MIADLVETGVGDPIRAEDHNELVRGLREITFQEGFMSVRPRPMPHPWKTRVEAGAKEGEWRVTMLRGYVNDIEATVAYALVDDPRGWTKPDTFPEARIKSGIAERSWREPKDAPWLLLRQPEDFVTVADGARPRAFRTKEAWEKTLLAASVYLYSRPAWAFPGRTLPARYRTWAGRMPQKPLYPFGVRELATVYILQGEEPGDVESFVQQKEFWDLAAEPVDPIKLLPAYVPLPGGFAIGGGLLDAGLAGFNAVAESMTAQINAALANISGEIATVEWWSV
jgi:hypothetical protein